MIKRLVKVLGIILGAVLFCFVIVPIVVDFIMLNSNEENYALIYLATFLSLIVFFVFIFVIGFFLTMLIAWIVTGDSNKKIIPSVRIKLRKNKRKKERMLAQEGAMSISTYIEGDMSLEEKICNKK